MRLHQMGPVQERIIHVRRRLLAQRIFNFSRSGATSMQVNRNTKERKKQAPHFMQRQFVVNRFLTGAGDTKAMAGTVLSR